jgi:hypothetical protein
MTAGFAARLGAVVVAVESEQELQAEPIGDGQTFLLHAGPLNERYFEAHTRQFLSGEGDDIPRPREAPLLDCIDKLVRCDGNFRPFVLANTRDHRGHAKYLIETPAQLKSIMAFCGSADGERLIDRLIVSEFIRTPGDRYTSWRLAVTAVGEVMAAGLVYSAHTKTSSQTVVLDRLEQSYDPDNMVIRSAFEDPAREETYLHSRDIRSNIAAGGAVIPFLDPKRRCSGTKLPEGAREVLRDHGCDTAGSVMPPQLMELGSRIGKALGPYGDVTLGLDFLQTEDGEFYFREANRDQGPTVHRLSGYGKTDRAALVIMRRRAVGSVIRSVARPTT